MISKIFAGFIAVVTTFFVLLVITVLVALSNAFAGTASLSFGPTLNGTLGAQKMLTAGYEIRWDEPSIQLEGGGWNKSDGPGFTGFLGANLGVHVVSESGLAMRIGVGPVIVSDVDDRVSTLVNAHIQTRVGLEKENFACGVQYDHISNGGTGGANLGRDAIALYLGVPLWR